jgi:hypothetical protein
MDNVIKLTDYKERGDRSHGGAYNSAPRRDSGSRACIVCI